ncbi:5-(carboxyamino)imidazole ribonucleotide mutase [Prochlorococcus sp. MIT 1223]|uniref:5-(carboxyamino)imidazole ribonucleotide mutase n=1 Tax=Prochlorococcus sp. MIT 1223 TaxID=3096217 RepID=UPI0039C2F907
MTLRDVGKNPLVGIVMGSDSDLPTLLPAIKVLESFNIPSELRILSAHRTPDRMVKFAEEANSKGLKVIIAGAGGAAHLPGMIAAITPLPVIGVPVLSKALSGIDSMYSILQMPAGIPVATVAIGNGLNAGLLAIQILGISDLNLQKKLIEYRKNMHNEVVSKDELLGKLGATKYLSKS